MLLAFTERIVPIPTNGVVVDLRFSVEKVSFGSQIHFIQAQKANLTEARIFIAVIARTRFLFKSKLPVLLMSLTQISCSRR